MTYPFDHMAPTLEPYQSSAATWLHKRKLGLVVSPAGSGKTIIAAATLSLALQARRRTDKVKVGWLCNTIEQSDQALKALALFPDIHDKCAVGIACAAADSDWSDCGLLIVDECHHATSQLWASQVETAKGARWGFTATESVGDIGRDAPLLEMFGGSYYEVEREEVGVSRLVPARVVLLEASDPGAGEAVELEAAALFKRYSRTWRRQEVAKLASILRRGDDPRAALELESIRREAKGMAIWRAVTKVGIAGNLERTVAGVQAATEELAAGVQVLALVNEVEHGEEVAKRVAEAGFTVSLGHSKMGKKRRGEAMERFRSQELSCLVATSLADEGLDLPSVGSLVLFSGGRSKVKTEQRTGRALRAFAGKESATVYDFADQWHPVMAKHSKSRQALYRELGYKLEGEL